VLLAVVTAIGGTATLVALGASVRTSDAYARHLDEEEVGDVVINPALATTDSDALLRSLPGVRRVTHVNMFAALIDDDGAPRAREDFVADPRTVLVRGSIDGRHRVMDRPVVVHGRLPTGEHEALVTVDLADERDLEVGDPLTVSFWHGAIDLVGLPDDVVEPLGVEHLTVVGIVTMSDEVLPDALFPRGQVIVSPQVAERYSCLPEVPPGDPTFEELVAVLLPEDCSVLYPYYSLDVAGGARGLDAALDAFVADASALNADLPSALLDDGAFYSLIATTTAQEQARVERSVQPIVTALAGLGIGAAAITVLVAGLVVARDLRRADAEQLQWWRLGLTARDRSFVLGVAPLGAIAVGVVLAIVGAWVASPVAPVGTVRAVDPSPARALAVNVVLAAAGLLAVAAVLTVGLTLRAVRRVGGATRPGRRPGAVQRLARASGRPALVEGVRAAFDGGRAVLAVVSGGVASGVLVAAVVFGSSLAHVVDDPESFGWPWDAAMLGGAGYGSQDVEAMQETLSGHEDLAAWTALAFGTYAVEGEQVVTVIALGPPSTANLSLVSGELPDEDGEVALATATAADHDVGVGDEVQLDGEAIGRRRAVVTGIVVMPVLGPYQANRASPGAGMLLPAASFPDELLANETTFVGMEVTPGGDADALLADLQDDFEAWALAGDVPIVLPDPVRPPEIVDAASIRSAPLLLGAFLAAAAGIGLAFAISASVRSRRRELATLRALGFTGRQLRAAVGVQAVAIAIAGIAVGVPVGIATGRVAWRAYATQLGVVPDASIPVALVLATVAGALCLSAAVAAVPGRAAARAHPASVLRSE
jgi:hypothetical protein